MIPRRIDLIKTGNNQYMCSGTSCDNCKFRFECFTMDKSDIVVIDWDKLHKEVRDSPSRVLKGLVGSQVFVKGSKKYKKYMALRQEAYIEKIPPEQIERVLDILKKI